MTQRTLVPTGKAIYDKMSWVVAIDDDGGGEFVVVSDGDGTRILINPEEWPHLRDVISEMISECQA